MSMFVTSLLNYISEYKTFLGINIKSFPKENYGNKVPMEMVGGILRKLFNILFLINIKDLICKKLNGQKCKIKNIRYEEY